jgi:hypothetical protein
MTATTVMRATVAAAAVNTAVATVTRGVRRHVTPPTTPALRRVPPRR